MPIAILMPALSPTMTEGAIARWLKQEGDTVSSGNVLCEIETDKAVMEVEAVDSGKLGKILVPDGSKDVKVNSTIAWLLQEGETTADIPTATAKASGANNEVQQLPTTASKPKEATKEATNVATGDPVSVQPQHQPAAPDNARTDVRIFASPLARRIARQQKIDLAQIKGSGPRGRIIKVDVEDYQQQPAASQVETIETPYQLEPASSTRKVIASRLSEAKQTIPHFYLNVKIKADQLLQARAQLNEHGKVVSESAPAISVNDLIIMASAKALAASPAINSSWDSSGIKRYQRVDIAVAVATDKGLYTPVLRNVATWSLNRISTTVRQLAAQAKSGKLKPEEYSGGNFTISNLGMYGVSSFQAIINPPQSCILAIGTTETVPDFDANDQIVKSTIMHCSLSADHRVVDGVDAAKFMQILSNFIENPLLLLS